MGLFFERIAGGGWFFGVCHEVGELECDSRSPWMRWREIRIGFLFAIIRCAVSCLEYLFISFA